MCSMIYLLLTISLLDDVDVDTGDTELKEKSDDLQKWLEHPVKHYTTLY